MARKADKDDGVHPSADLTGRHIDDQRLRRHGFRILKRPRNGEAIWTRDGHSFTDREAHAVRRAAIAALGTRRTA